MAGTELAVGPDHSQNIEENGIGNNQDNGSEHTGENVHSGENVNGHTGENGDPMFPCGRPSCSTLATKKCSKCRAVYYCSRQAQHKKIMHAKIRPIFGKL